MQSLCLLLALAASAALAPVPEPGFGPSSRSGDAVSLVLLLVACSVVLRSQVQVTPVQKVVQLLENMKEKGTKEMQEEEVQYTKFKQFCDMTLREKEAAIDEAADKIETLEADIEKAASEAERLGKEMSEHQADIEAATAEKEKATAVREKGRTDFQLTLKDYSESIDAIARALKALKEEDKKTALLQLADAKLLPDEARQSLLDTQGPAPKTYEFQSGGVISMLEGLQDKFVDERISLEREEQKKRHAYEMLAQSLDSQLAQSKKEQEEKGQFKAKQLQSKASSEGDLGETKVEKQSDEKYSTDLAATCSKKAAAFAARQKLRQEEIEAIEKAKGIIAGEAVAGSAGKHLPSLLQGPKRTALAFLRSEVREPQSERVARFLQQRASALNSRVLSAVAGRAAADPIAKVRTMIEQLITKMQTQQNEEASKNGWCNAELASNKATREEKTDAVDELSSDADELSTAIGKLGEEVSTLSRQVSELDADMAKATQMREEESAKNAATVKDAKEAQAAVAQALLVLRDFYKKAAGASSLAQMRGEARGEARAEPKVFGDEPYTGMGESGGVISMLEVIQSDFAQLQAETEAAEESGLKEYQDFMEDSKVDKATKVRASEHKASKKQAKAQELTAVRADLKGTQKELDAAKAYFEKLKPDCLDTGASYAERQAQRKQEAPSPAVTSLSRRPPVAPTSPHVARSLACRSESRAVAVLPPFVPRWRTSRRPSRCSRRSEPFSVPFSAVLGVKQRKIAVAS